MPATGTLGARAEEVAADCRKVADALAAQAVKSKLRRSFARGINVVFGGLAFAAAYIQPFTQLIGTGGAKSVALVSAVVLILDGVSPLFIGDDTYERLTEYAFYVRRFSTILLDTLADDQLPIEVRRARLSEILAIANQNLDDVRSKWPWVDFQKLKIPPAS